MTSDDLSRLQRLLHAVNFLSDFEIDSFFKLKLKASGESFVSDANSASLRGKGFS